MSKPIRVSRLTLAQDAHDYQGAAVADGTVKLLLCPRCTLAAIQAINGLRGA